MDSAGLKQLSMDVRKAIDELRELLQKTMSAEELLRECLTGYLG